MIKKIVSSLIFLSIFSKIFFRPCTDEQPVRGIWRALAEEEARSSSYDPLSLVDDNPSEFGTAACDRHQRYINASSAIYGRLTRQSQRMWVLGQRRSQLG